MSVIDKAITVECPRCGAEPYQKCRDKDGHLAPGLLMHQARAEQWKTYQLARCDADHLLHLPDNDTLYRERDNASLKDCDTPSDYPVRALCKTCGRLIRMTHFYTSKNWETVDE